MEALFNPGTVILATAAIAMFSGYTEVGLKKIFGE